MSPSDHIMCDEHARVKLILVFKHYFMVIYLPLTVLFYRQISKWLPMFHEQWVLTLWYHHILFISKLRNPVKLVKSLMVSHTPRYLTFHYYFIFSYFNLIMERVRLVLWNQLKISRFIFFLLFFNELSVKKNVCVKFWIIFFQNMNFYRK